MVARVVFPLLTCRGNAIIPPAPGDHKGPPFPASSTLAPTDHPASCLSSRLRLMPIGGPLWSPALLLNDVGPQSHLRIDIQFFHKLKFWKLITLSIVT